MLSLAFYRVFNKLEGRKTVEFAKIETDHCIIKTTRKDSGDFNVNF